MHVEKLLLTVVLLFGLPAAAEAAPQAGAAPGATPGSEAGMEAVAPQQPVLETPGLVSESETGFYDVWTYEILKIEGSPVTVGNIAVGLALLLIGFLASRFLSGLVRRTVFQRLRLREGGAAAFETLLFYLFLMLFAVSGLKIAGVPLTAFTLLGGAAAIGVGFGSQNVINNFISGLIILAERPVNVGNLIQVGDLYGVVERVGPRSTRVRTGRQRRDHRAQQHLPRAERRQLDADRVARPHPRRRRRRLRLARRARSSQILRRAVDEHERVLKSPEPIVLFTDFGANSLDFEVHFWIEMRRIMDRRIIESEIRQSIDRLFREAGIVIAFPQRDVHLDTTRPIEVVVQR